jgi:hypothetical protein
MTQQSHAERGHSTWSASSTERNWECAGALALTDGLPDTESEAAAWGTACHTISERVLRGNGPASKFVGEFIKTKSHSIEVDDEMVETSEVYTDYVTSIIESEADGVQFWIEQNFTLASLNPPFEAGGTADAVIYLPRIRTLEVIDLKGGRGHVVEATGNKQGRSYGLGALLAHQGLDVERVKVTIVQPRAPHKDGRIRSDEFHVADLVEWTADLVAAMHRAYDATISKAEYDFSTTAMAMPPAEWASTFLKPGDHCKFCKAKATCPAVEKAALDAVGIWFDDLDQPRLANAMNGDDPVQLARDLDMLDLIEGWCNARRERAHMLAESGVEIPNYVLVPKQGREKWTDDAEAKVLAAAKAAGLAPAKYLNPGKLRTPKQVRKELGASAALIDGLSETPSAGTNLVRADKTTRQPVAAAVHTHFQPL